MSIQNNYTLITGASKGIGKELAFKCAKEKMNLILVARTEDKLKELKGKLEKKYNIKVEYYPIDLTKSSVGEEIYDWCIKKGLMVNMLINNAGIGLFGEFEKLNLDNQLRVIDLNIKTIVSLTHYFLPMIKNRNKGYILNVSSVAGLYPLGYASVYSATKSFVSLFTEALQYELKDSSVIVSCLYPGDTDTNFFDDANTKADLAMKPDIVAKIAIDKLLSGKTKIFPKYIKLVSKIPKSILKHTISKLLKKDLNIK
ncbi:UNVERIFIED_CONTAM: hypothetical protein Cloal_0530 [Acetivibrio alkalicellulosi]